MSEETTERRIKIEDLPEPTEELSVAEADEVKGGTYNKGTTNPVIVFER